MALHGNEVSEMSKSGCECRSHCDVNYDFVLAVVILVALLCSSNGLHGCELCSVWVD